MPHISKKTLDDKTYEQLEEIVSSFLIETGVGARQAIFHELFTKTERMMIAKRLIMIFLIGKGLPTNTISEILKVSPSTVARFENQAEKNNFPKTLSWLKKYHFGSRILRFLTALAKIPFEAKFKPLSEIME